MKITKTNLRKMIKEELSAVMSEDYEAMMMRSKRATAGSEEKKAADAELAAVIAKMDDKELKNRVAALKSSLFGAQMADSYDNTNYARAAALELGNFLAAVPADTRKRLELDKL
jgi:hypothetical protein